MQKDISINIYKNFKTELESKGFFNRNYLYYSLLFLFIVFGLSISLYFITLSNDIFFQILNAILFAFFSVQAGMLGHDFSHKQVFNSEFLNRTFAVFCWSFLAGVSESRWYEKHNEHHKEVNHADHDPDIKYPFAFTDVHRNSMKDNVFFIYFSKLQHVIFFIALPFIYVNFILQTFVFILRNINTKNLIDLVLIFLHFFIFLYVLCMYLPFVVATTFFIVYGATTGVYMSLVFAPNHKGMEVIPSEDKIEWFHQIICTRNIFPNKFIFHTMGGLGYQIEHHLFTNMPRINYPKVAPLVKEFCKKNNLEYYETTWWESMREIFTSLKEQAKKA
jgi:fatty acid desaturase